MRNIMALICLLLFCSAAWSTASAYTNSAPPEYNLSVSFDIPHSRLAGIVKIDAQKDERFVFDVSDLSIVDVMLNGVKIAFENKRAAMNVLTDRMGVLEIAFKGAFSPSGSDNLVAGVTDMADDAISERGIFLTGIWYPRPHNMMSYRLSAVLPNDYEAVSEADQINLATRDGKREFTFFFDHPNDHLNFIASNRFNIIKDNFDNIDIYAYFFSEDMGLAKEYLEHAKRYFGLYQKMLTPYPYRRFSIVENILPTGYSMPTFTVLGQDVVRLPFIVRTSLGHEILHQWFGNSVYIDYEKGNWAEGLTTYLADHLYAAQKGEGADYRKQILIDYQSYVNKDNVFPLREFRGRTDSSSKAIGYGKGAMFFHMLNKLIGEDLFQQALRNFIIENDFKKASWANLMSSFAATYGIKLTDFFDQWLDRTTVPELTAGSAIVRQKGEGYEISFSIQQVGRPYALMAPITIYSAEKKETIPWKIDKEVNPVTLYSRELPARIVIDEDYDLMRSLSAEEFPVVIARILGEASPILILPQSARERYQNIIKTFSEMGILIKEASDINDSLITTNSFIILGASNSIIDRFSAVVAKNAILGGFTMDVRKNPFNPTKVLAIINTESIEEADAAFPKIFHYGKYSRLAFNKGKNILKETNVSQKGLPVEMEAEATAVKMSDLKGLSQVIKDVSDKQVVYVGENHDNYANHAVQLEFIKELSRSGVQIAIGMEMFQKPFQSVIDDFIRSAIDQKTFLKKTEYFKRWGFDYDLYKPILDYARDNRIPVIALNIEKEIVEQVSKTGIDALPRDLRAKIPSEIDLSDVQYKERMEKVFESHESLKGHNFDFFYQAQILWDESMSQSIADYLSAHPDRRMIVLAGNGHLTYCSGIPKRTARRNGLSYAVVLNDAELEKGIADYVVFPKHIEATKPVRMMVLLEEEKGQVKIKGFPENSISQKAGLAEGDIIMSIDGVPINSIDDVKICLIEKHKGEKIRVIISRGVSLTAKEMQFEIEL
jgi:aminopeptidase N